MATMSVGGLASGLDTNSIVSQLVALEQAKVTREAKKKEAAQGTLDKFKELQSKLSNLSIKANGLNLPKNFNLFSSKSTHEDNATVSGGEGAAAGRYELVVNQLASTQKVASKSFAAMNQPVGASGKIYISPDVATKKTNPTQQDFEIKIDSSDTLRDIANKINAAEGAGVKASIMADNGEYRLVLTAVDTGTQSFYLREDGGSNILYEKLGLLDSDTTKGKVVSGTALLNKDSGFAITASDTIDKIATVLNKNTFEKDDKFGISVPDGSGKANWITVDLFEDNDKSKPKTMGQILTELNTKLTTSGVKASLNSSGEIVLEGNTNTGAFKIQMGAFGEVDKNIYATDSSDPRYLDSDEYKAYLVEHQNYLDNEYQDYLDNEYQDYIDTPDYQQYLQDKADFDLDPDSFPNGEPVPPPPPPPPPPPLPPALDQVVVDTEQVTEPTAGTIKKDLGILGRTNVFANEINEGKNAFYKIDGVAATSKSNDDDKIIQGTTFTLKKADPSQVVTVTLNQDFDGLATKISEFMEEFNDLLKFIAENQKVSIVQKEDPVTGIKGSSREVSAFTGDAAINSLKEKLKQMMTGMINELSGVNKDAGYSTQYSSASRVGILTERDGSISVDKEKLIEAMKTDFDGVRRLFSASSFSNEPGFTVGNFTKYSQTGTYQVNSVTGEVWQNGTKLNSRFVANIITLDNGISFEVPTDKKAGDPGSIANVTFVRGIASQISNFVEMAKTATVNSEGKVIEGYYKASEKTYQERIDSLQKRVDDLQVRVDRYNSRISSQFVALERSMGNLQSQAANMTSALSNLYSYNNKK